MTEQEVSTLWITWVSSVVCMASVGMASRCGATYKN
jgi:hypothetical protein